MNTGDFQWIREPARPSCYSTASGRSVQSYVPAMDEGLDPLALEQFGFTYTSLFNHDIQAGNLKDRFDVVVFPDQRAETIQQGYKPGRCRDSPEALARQAQRRSSSFASKGGADLSERSFGVRTEISRPGVKDALNGISNREFYSPGALLNVRLERIP